MSGTNGLTCSECGRAERYEIGLYRRRRRWLPLVLSLPLWAAASVSHRVPDIRDDGWEAGVPTFILIAMLPQICPDPRMPDVPDPDFMAIGFAPPDLGERLTAHLLHRCQDDQLWNWQWTLLVERILGGDPDRLYLQQPGIYESASGYGDLIASAYRNGHLTPHQLTRADATSRVEFDLNPDWPEGAPIHGEVAAHHWQNADLQYTVSNRESGALILKGKSKRWDGFWSCGIVFSPSPWRETLTLLASSAPESGVLAYRVEISASEDANTWRHVRTYDVDVPISVHGGIEDHILSLSDSAVNDSLRNMPTPVIESQRESPGSALLSLDLGSISKPLFDAGIGVFAVRLDVCDGDTVLASESAWWCLDTFSFWPSSTGSAGYARITLPRCTITLHPKADDMSCFQKPGLTLRIVGDPIVALRDRDLPTCWSGDVTLPLECGNFD